MDLPKEASMPEAKEAKPLRKRSKIRGGTEDLTEQISELLKLEISALRDKWCEVIGAEPSPQFGRTLLLQRIPAHSAFVTAR
jgi:hypothetical protein